MSSYSLVRERIQTWQIVVSATVSGYLALGVATHSIRGYHWLMLLAIPAALWAWRIGRQFFVNWAPLFAFWMVYDRLRLVQPHLLDRVAVKTPYLLELWAFGWMTGGEVPAHAAARVASFSQRHTRSGQQHRGRRPVDLPVSRRHPSSALRALVVEGQAQRDLSQAFHPAHARFFCSASAGNLHLPAFARRASVVGRALRDGSAISRITRSD